jgi:PEP-CTERM motif
MTIFKAGAGAIALLFAVQANAATVTIDFEGLAPGSVVGTISGATFSGTGDIIVFDFLGQFAQSGVNTIADASSFSADLYVDFASAVSGLSFYSSGDNDVGVQAQIRVFVNGLVSSIVNLVGDGDVLTTDLQDLSAFNDVTRIEIFNVTDAFGLVYDDFTFTTGSAPPPVPLPASVLLLGAGLAGLGVFGRRKAV